MEEDVTKTVIKTLRAYLNDELPLDKDFIRELDRRDLLASKKAPMLVALVDKGDMDCINQLVTYIEQFYTEEMLLRLCVFLEEYAQPARLKLATIASRIRQEILKLKPPLPLPEYTLLHSPGILDAEVVLSPVITPLRTEFASLVAEVFFEIERLNDELIVKLHTFLSILLASSCVPETVDKMKKYLRVRWNELNPKLLEAIVNHLKINELTKRMTHYQQSLSKEDTTSLGECSTESTQTVITSKEALVSVKIDQNPDQQTLGDVFLLCGFLNSLRISYAMFRGFNPGCIVLFFSIPTECVWSLPSCLLPSNLSLLEKWKVISLSVKGAFTVDIKERRMVDSFNKHSLLSSMSECKILNKHLETRNDALQIDKFNLQTRNDDLKTRNDDLQTRIVDLQTREKAMGGELEVSIMYLRHFQNRNDDLKTRNDDLQTRSDDLKTRSDDLQTVIASLKTRNDDVLQTQVKDLQTRNDDLKTRYDELQTCNDDLKTRNDDLQTLNDDLQTSNNDALQTQVKDLQTRNDDLEDEVCTLKENLQQTRTMANTKQNELLALKRKLSEAAELNLSDLYWKQQEPGVLEDLREPTAVCVKDQIFICGRYYSFGRQLYLHIFNVSNGTWSDQLRFHESREMNGTTLATTNNQVHCLGGDWKKDETQESSSKVVFTLDCDSLQWSDNTLPPLNIGRMAAASTSFEGMIVVAGGKGENEQWLSSVEVLNSFQQSSTWWNICELSVRPEKITCTVSDTDLFVGCDAVGDTDRTLYSCKLSAVKEAMITGDSTSPESFWHALPKIPLGQSGLGVVKNCLISVGGKDDCGSNSTAVYLYESRKNTWTNLKSSQISKSRLYPAVVPCNIEHRHELFVLGGEGSDAYVESCAYF